MGKALTHLSLNIEVLQFERWMLDVMRDVTMRTEQVHARDGKSYMLRITPYRTLENKIDGVVVALLDISDLLAAGSAKNEPGETELILIVPSFSGSAATACGGNGFNRPRHHDWLISRPLVRQPRLFRDMIFRSGANVSKREIERKKRKST